LAGAMKRFLSAPDLIAVMGKQSRQYAQARYDVHQVNAVIMREMGLP